MANEFSHVITNRVIILGHGIEIGEDNQVKPSHGGLQRANRFLDYYHQHQEAFDSTDARVVCTGGYALLAAGLECPEDNSLREGLVAKQYLLDNGVNEEIIRVEKDSISTLSNFALSMKLGHIAVDEFTGENPLGIISHPNHLKLAISSLLEGGLEIVTLLVFALALLIFDKRLNVLGGGFKALMVGVAIVGIVVLIPAVFNRLIQRAYKLLRHKDIESEHLATNQTILRGTSLYLVNSLINGTSLFFHR